MKPIVKLTNSSIITDRSLYDVTFRLTRDQGKCGLLVLLICQHVLISHLLLRSIYILLLVYSSFSDRVGLPLNNIPSPFPYVMDIFFVDLKFGHICFYTL